jgi:hypothetical protein
VGISGREGKQRENMVDALSICEWEQKMKLAEFVFRGRVKEEDGGGWT